MSTTSCTAFLQSHVGRLPSPAGTAIRLLPGTKIGAWRVIGARQPCTRSDSYPVAHDRDGALAALTVFDMPAVPLASYTRRILETAQTLTALDHPGVASVVDAGLVADGRPYIVTEAHRGMSLVDRIADEMLDPVDALAILRGICEPLSAAHEMGVVHGSLAMEHVFLVDFDDSTVRLLDWGVERAIVDEARRAGLELPAFVYPTAPEASLGIMSPKVDSYALGVIAYQLLLRCLPFEADTQMGVRLLQEATQPDPRALWPSIPPALETLLCELLAVDPRARPSVRSTAERLAAIANDLAPPPVVFVPSTEELTPACDVLPEPVEWRQPFNWRIAAVVTATVASAALAIAVVRRADDVATIAGARSQPVLHTPEIASAPGTSNASAAAIDPPRSVLAPPPAPEPRAVPAPPPALRVEAPPPAPRVMSPPARPQPAVIARAAAASQTTRRPPPERVRPAPTAGPRSSDLLTQYQRIGHALLELRRARPTPATTEMWQQFQALKIQPALASATTRASAAATLRELREKIERHKGVTVTDTCRANPLADGCR